MSPFYNYLVRQPTIDLRQPNGFVPILIRFPLLKSSVMVVPVSIWTKVG